MEKLYEPKSTIITRFSYMCNILVYYGYVSECAELFRQLSKEWRQVWDDNIDVIHRVIMQNKNFRMKLSINCNISKRIIDYLLKNNNYTYYLLEIAVSDKKNIRFFTNFLSQLTVYPKCLFSNVDIKLGKESFDELNELIEVYN